jgi:hypothetical protein
VWCGWEGVVLKREMRSSGRWMKPRDCSWDERWDREASSEEYKSSFIDAELGEWDGGVGDEERVLLSEGDERRYREKSSREGPAV